MAARINEAAGHLGSENGGPEIKMLNQGIHGLGGARC